MDERKVDHFLVVYEDGGSHYFDAGGDSPFLDEIAAKMEKAKIVFALIPPEEKEKI